MTLTLTADAMVDADDVRVTLTGTAWWEGSRAMPGRLLHAVVSDEGHPRDGEALPVTDALQALYDDAAREEMASW